MIRSKKSTGQLGSTILVESVLILNRQVFLASFWTQICAGCVLLKLETAVNSCRDSAGVLFVELLRSRDCILASRAAQGSDFGE